MSDDDPTAIWIKVQVVEAERDTTPGVVDPPALESAPPPHAAVGSAQTSAAPSIAPWPVPSSDGSYAPLAAPPSRSEIPLELPIRSYPTRQGHGSALRTALALAAVLLLCVVSLEAFQMAAAASVSRVHLFAGAAELGARQTKRVAHFSNPSKADAAAEDLDLEITELSVSLREEREQR